MFSHMFLLFQLLLLVFLRNRYLLVSSRLSWLHGNLIFCPVSCTIGTPSWYIIHVPPCFRHRMQEFFKARCSWEPGSSLTTSEFSLFRHLPKVSAVNVFGMNTIHTFLSHKNPWTDTFLRALGLAKLCSTARVWNHQKDIQTREQVDCCLYVLPTEQELIPEY